MKADTFWLSGKPAANVIAIKAGGVEPDKLIVIGAHYDSIVLMGGDPMTIAPGADDNGSGTAGVIEIARGLASDSLRKSIMFVLFAAEEQGIVGSETLAIKLKNQGAQIDFLLNLDMIGFTSDTIPDVFIDVPAAYTDFRNLVVSSTNRFTSLQPKFISGGIGSDHQRFLEQGFPAALFIERDAYLYIHSARDTPDKLNFSYMREMTQMALGCALGLSEYPVQPLNLQVLDIGDGNSLALNWTPSSDTAINGYNICWRTGRGEWQGTKTVAKTTIADTLTGLTMGVSYDIAVSAFYSPEQSCLGGPEQTLTPLLLPRTPTGFTAQPLYRAVSLYWRPNIELDFDHYLLTRISSQSDTVRFLTPDTTFIDSIALSNQHYRYLVQAVDKDGFQSNPAEVIAIPITLDQGIIFVDETGSGFRMPTEDQQKQFYDRIAVGYQYRYVSFLGDSASRPTLDLLGQYSTIVWIDDDYQEHLLGQDTAALRYYLSFGGGLFFSWLAYQ